MVVVRTLDAPYSCEVSNGRHTLISDTKKEKGGRGAGFRPHELLEASLGSCIAMTVWMYAQGHGIRLNSVSVEVELDKSGEGAVIFRKRLDMDGVLTDREREKILAISERCPVQRTLQRGMRFVTVP